MNTCDVIAKGVWLQCQTRNDGKVKHMKFRKILLQNFALDKKSGNTWSGKYLRILTGKPWYKEIILKK